MITLTMLKEFINNNLDILNLPIEVETGNKVFQTLEKRWDSYLTLINKTEWLKECIPNIKFYINTFKIAKKLYYQGKMIAANNKICNILTRITKTKFCNYINEYYIDEESKHWFRARRGIDVNFTKEDMWHIPFNKRSLITNQRYSINGIPCLYLGSSIFSCWEELDRPSFNEFWVNRFMPKYEYYKYILNLSINPFELCNYDKYFTDDNYIKDFFEMWIVQSACSIHVQEKVRNFKEEYIYPQLIMQNLYKAGIDGIMYFSVKMKNAYTQPCSWISKQLALPAFDDDFKSLYSAKLREAFLYSEPLNVALYQNRVCYSTTQNYSTNTNWARCGANIYFSKNMSQRYSETIFFNCENELLQEKYGLFD